MNAKEVMAGRLASFATTLEKPKPEEPAASTKKATSFNLTVSGDDDDFDDEFEGFGDMKDFEKLYAKKEAERKSRGAINVEDSDGEDHGASGKGASGLNPFATKPADASKNTRATFGE